MRFPLRHHIGVHTYSSGSPDEYNIITPGFSPPLDQPGKIVAVYGWSVPQSTEPTTAGHDRIIVDVNLLAPPGTPITAYDWIDLPDGRYEVIGDAADYTHSPFGSGGGLVFSLRKVSG